VNGVCDCCGAECRIQPTSGLWGYGCPCWEEYYQPPARFRWLFLGHIRCRQCEKCPAHCTCETEQEDHTC
jgi:hypothetical protein